MSLKILTSEWKSVEWSFVQKQIFKIKKIVFKYLEKCTFTNWDLIIILFHHKYNVNEKVMEISILIIFIGISQNIKYSTFYCYPDPS